MIKRPLELIPNWLIVGVVLVFIAVVGAATSRKDRDDKSIALAACMTQVGAVWRTPLGVTRPDESKEAPTIVCMGERGWRLTSLARGCQPPLDGRLHGWFDADPYSRSCYSR